MNPQSPARLFLIDGMAQLYRAHFGMIHNPLITRDGRHTSAIFGFMNMLFKLIRDENPDYLAIIMDSREPTFRHKLYTDYKATRERMPEELVQQLEPLREVIAASNIPVIAKPGYEADDIIGTFAKQAEKEGFNTFIVTGDKDMMQLISESTFMFTTGNRFKPTTIYDIQGVIDKWGVSPDKIIDFLTLLGDSSDNIPGVDGIGKVGAAKLLTEYGTLDNIILHTGDIKNKRARNGLINSKDMIHLSKELVTILTDVPLELHVNEIKRKPMKKDALSALFEDLEIYSLINQIEGVTSDETNPGIEVKKEYKTVSDMANLDEMINQLMDAPLVSFDLETTSVDALTADIVGLSFSIHDNSGWYIPVEYPEKINSIFDEFGLDLILKKLSSLFENAKYKFCGQNIKYDALVLSRYGVALNGIEFDTMVAAHLIRPESGRFKMDYLSIEFLNYHMKPITDLIGTGKNQKSMADVPLEEISFYAAEDADIAFQLTGVFKEKLKEKHLEDAFHKIELPLIPVLIQIEKNGIVLDLDFLKKLSVKIHAELGDFEIKIHQMAGKEFNINSPKQLAEILFDELQLKPIRKRSTDVNVLGILKNHHPLPGLILDYRHLKKLSSTYIDAFPDYVNSASGRVHTSLNQTIAATGRLSSTRPNFQNIPIRTSLGKEIRKAFISGKKGWKIISADYSQIELRVMAHFSNEKELIRSFNKNEDIHTRTASTVFGISPDEVTSDQRRTAKIVNFGIMYGAGPYRMSQELNIGMQDAKSLIESYFKTYPGIRGYIDKTLEAARKDGYVQTLFGRKRYTPNLLSESVQAVQAEERMAINMPIQGTAAEIIKIAMCRIHDKLISGKFKSMMILQVHDELLFEVPEDEVSALTEMIVFEMENAAELAVPLKVEYGIGDNWFEAH